MIIKGASVFCEDGTFQVKDVFVEDHKIVATEAEVSDKTVVDANGYKLIPGLVDVHSHGACGHDFCDCDIEGVKEILRFEKAHGITSYCPTSMILSKEMLVDIFATAKEADGIADGARVIGINMEGPFIAPEKKGAQNVIVSMAGEGAVFVGSDGSVFTSEAPHGVVKNSVGAGDSMVAGFLAGYLAKGDYAEACKMGLCTGSASAFSDQLATREEVEQVRRSHIFDF